MLSALPKLADRNFILGFFLPALLFTLGVLTLFSDHPKIHPLITNLTSKDVGDAAFLLVGVWLLGVLMLSVNHPLYRLLEGYSWPVSLFRRKREHYRNMLRRGKRELRKLYDRSAAEGDAVPQADWTRYRELTLELTTTLPSRETDVMPTAFGNAIKAFEIYPRDVYGADAPPIWLRLIAVVPKAVLEQIQEVRTQVDFLINCCLLVTALASFALAKALWVAPWRLVGVTSTGVLAFLGAFPWMILAASAAAFLGAWIFYVWAVTRVPAWGELVMSVFDCYLPALAKQLGFELPRKGEERAAFWTTFSQMVVYRRDPAGHLPFNPEDWQPVKVGCSGGKDKAQDEGGDSKGESKEEGG